MEWFDYLAPTTFTGVLTFLSIFSLGVYAHIKVYSFDNTEQESGK